MESIRLRGNLLTVESKDGGNGNLCVFHEEFSRDLGTYGSGYVLAYYLERIRINTEVVRAELAEFLATRTHCECETQTNYIAQFTVHN